jgi:succinyl-CoA synthetase beta subunit
LPAAGAPAAPRLLPEAEAKACLSRFGVDVPRGETVAGPEAAADAAERIGFPVVLKTSGLAHKTEAGGVALNLSDRDDVLRAARSMAAVEYLVEEMIGGGAVEVLVGVLRDPASGFVLTLGAGGTLTEILQDTVSLLVPASHAEIDDALSRLRIAPLLDGYRGAPPVDRGALLAAIGAVQDCVAAHAGELLELEINPLIVTPDRAVAADALITMGEG